MKIIFSPTKSQSTGASRFTTRSSVLFPEKTKELIKLLSELSRAQISELFKTSDTLTDKIYQLYQTKNPPILPAIELFSGLSFRQLELDTYNLKQQKYVQAHLVILSAFYGILRPFDEISEYRLDMVDKLPLKDSSYKNLYDFWHNNVVSYFETADSILNLASSEYAKMIIPHYYGNIITCHFLVDEEGAIKPVAALAKRERGNMLNYCIVNQVTDIEILKRYSSNDFIFNKERSSENDYYFIYKK